MKIELLVIGKIKQDFVKQGILEYSKRIGHFINFKVNRLPAVKLKTNNQLDIINVESEKFLSKIDKLDNVILLEIGGKSLNTIEFSRFIEKNINSYPGKSFFIIGGAYGINEKLKKRANHSISMSGFTFTHDMAQLILLEQIYRGYTILNNIPYHH